MNRASKNPHNPINHINPIQNAFFMSFMFLVSNFSRG